MEDYHRPIDPTLILPGGFQIGLTMGFPPDTSKDDKKKELRRRISEITMEAKTVGVYSLATSGKNDPMWLHYADRRKGFCIEYFFEESLLQEAGMIYAALVEYPDKYPDIDLARYEMYPYGERLRLALMFKSPSWKYEVEYRVIYSEGNRHYSVPGSVNRIIFGLESEKTLIDRVKAALQGQCEHFSQVVAIDRSGVSISDIGS
jgi:hypothetical protein